MRIARRVDAWIVVLLAVMVVDTAFAGPRRTRGVPAPLEGFYVLQGTDKPGNVRSSDVDTEKIAGVSLRFSWKRLEPQRGVYDWAELDAEIERFASLGKAVTIRPQAGAWAPAWLYSEGAQSTRSDKGNKIPMPWDPVMLAAWSDFVAALGERYHRDRNVSAIHLSGPVADSAEMHLPDALWNESGSEDQVFAAWALVIDAFNEAFPRKTLVLNVANPFSSKDGLAERVSDYLILVAGQRAALQINSLSAKTQETFNVFDILVEKSAVGVHVGFQMLSGSHQSRFGGSFSKALTIAEAAAPHYFEIYQGDINKVPN